MARRRFTLQQGAEDGRVRRKMGCMIESRHDQRRLRVKIMCLHPDEGIGVLQDIGTSGITHYEACIQHDVEGTSVSLRDWSFIEECNPHWANGCDCGANAATSPTFHMYFCHGEDAKKYAPDRSRMAPTWTT